MPTEADINKLVQARNFAADIHNSQTKDEAFDNGLLDILNEIVKGCESAKRQLQARIPEEPE